MCIKEMINYEVNKMGKVLEREKLKIIAEELKEIAKLDIKVDTVEQISREDICINLEKPVGKELPTFDEIVEKIATSKLISDGVKYKMNTEKIGEPYITSPSSEKISHNGYGENITIEYNPEDFEPSIISESSAKRLFGDTMQEGIQIPIREDDASIIPININGVNYGHYRIDDLEKLKCNEDKEYDIENKEDDDILVLVFKDSMAKHVIFISASEYNLLTDINILLYDYDKNEINNYINSNEECVGFNPECTSKYDDLIKHLHHEYKTQLEVQSMFTDYDDGGLYPKLHHITTEIDPVTIFGKLSIDEETDSDTAPGWCIRDQFRKAIKESNQEINRHIDDVLPGSSISLRSLGKVDTHIEKITNGIMNPFDLMMLDLNGVDLDTWGKYPPDTDGDRLVLLDIDEHPKQYNSANYDKHLKRVRNRQKLYNKRKRMGRRL